MSSMVRVPVPGSADDAFIVRTPDLPTLLANGWLPLPLVHAVSTSMASSGEPQWVIETEDELAAEHGRFIDRWICACAILPRIVLDPTQAGDDALHVSEIDRALRLTILERTYVPLVARVHQAAAALEVFVAEGEEAIVLAAFARAYGQRPSEVACLVDPLLSVDFDLALALRLASHEKSTRTRTH